MPKESCRLARYRHESNAVTRLVCAGDAEVGFDPAYEDIPIATAVAMLREHGSNIGGAFDRKGGVLVGAPMGGRKVAIVDDVVTDGTAKREAVEIVSAAGRWSDPGT